MDDLEKQIDDLRKDNKVLMQQFLFMMSYAQMLEDYLASGIDVSAGVLVKIRDEFFARKNRYL